MDEVENQGSIQEVASPETESTQQAQQVETPVQQQDPAWLKNIRREREQYKREAEAQRLMNEQLLKLVNPQVINQQVAQPEEDLIQELQKEEYVPGDKVAKALRAVEQRNERKLQEIEAKFQQKHQVDQWQRLKGRYPDLEDVVNTETLKQVAQIDPELAQSWRNLDDYTLAIQAYPYIKHSGILGETTGDRRSKEIEKKLEEPKKSANSKTFETRPIAKAFSYKEQKEANDKLYAEMMGYASLTGGGY